MRGSWLVVVVAACAPAQVAAPDAAPDAARVQPGAWLDAGGFAREAAPPTVRLELVALTLRHRFCSPLTLKGAPIKGIQELARARVHATTMATWQWRWARPGRALGTLR